MRFVTVTHPTQGSATVPETAVPHMLDKGWTVAGDDAAAPVVAPVFDPAVHSVDEVKADLEYATVDERDRVLAAEKAGKNRSTLVGK